MPQERAAHSHAHARGSPHEQGAESARTFSNHILPQHTQQAHYLSQEDGTGLNWMPHKGFTKSVKIIQ